jgi:predicted  nucleic acid-binding Zn-ribbon protein
MEGTAVTLEQRRRLRHWFGGTAPPSMRAVVFLAVSTFLCGCVVASLLFVGIWRHTADEAAQLKAAQARTHAIQQNDRQQLQAANLQLEALKTRLARNQRLLAQAEERAAEAKTGLARARAASRASSRALTPRLQTLTETAAALTRQTAIVQSELTALVAYVRNPGPAGLDAGYLENQARYVGRNAAQAAAAAAALAQQARDAKASAP